MRIVLLFLFCLLTGSLCHEKMKGELKGVPTFFEMATANKFPVEMHKITTEDGYILTVFRIPGRQGETVQEALAHNYPTLLYIHGVLDSSDGVIVDETGDSPGYVFPDHGYDMWYYNYRGNTYCQEHVYLTPKEKAFWDFSFDTMAYYDIPAVLDYIIENTIHPQVNILGHSQGTMITWAFLTTHHDRVEGKIKSVSAWAPVARVDHATSRACTWFTKIPYIKEITDLLGINVLMPRNFLESEVQLLLCKYVAIMCVDLLKLMADESDTYDKKNMAIYLEHAPNGMSTKNGLHLYYIHNTKIFGPYPTDGEMTAYDFNNTLKVPIGIFAGTKDVLADPTDVNWLIDQLKAADALTLSKWYNAGHLTFLVPKVEDDDHIFDTLQFIDQYNKQYYIIYIYYIIAIYIIFMLLIRTLRFHNIDIFYIISSNQ